MCVCITSIIFILIYVLGYIWFNNIIKTDFTYFIFFYFSVHGFSKNLNPLSGSQKISSEAGKQCPKDFDLIFWGGGLH